MWKIPWINKSLNSLFFLQNTYDEASVPGCKVILASILFRSLLLLTPGIFLSVLNYPNKCEKKVFLKKTIKTSLTFCVAIKDVGKWNSIPPLIGLFFSENMKVSFKTL